MRAVALAPQRQTRPRRRGHGARRQQRGRAPLNRIASSCRLACCVRDARVEDLPVRRVVHGIGRIDDPQLAGGLVKPFAHAIGLASSVSMLSAVNSAVGTAPRVESHAACLELVIAHREQQAPIKVRRAASRRTAPRVPMQVLAGRDQLPVFPENGDALRAPLDRAGGSRDRDRRRGDSSDRAPIVGTPAPIAPGVSSRSEQVTRTLPKAPSSNATVPGFAGSATLSVPPKSLARLHDPVAG